MKTKQFIATAALTAVVFMLPAASFAQSPAADQRKVERCAEQKLRVERRIVSYKVIHEKRLDRWNKASALLDKVIAKLKANGYDVALIEQDQADMRQYTDALGTSYDTIMSDYNSFKSIDCSDTAGFQAAFDKLQADNKSGNANLKSFFDQFRKTKQDLLSYKSVVTPAPVTGTPE